jgi:hypothetical protein
VEDVEEADGGLSVSIRISVSPNGSGPGTATTSFGFFGSPGDSPHDAALPSLGGDFMAGDQVHAQRKAFSVRMSAASFSRQPFVWAYFPGHDCGVAAVVVSECFTAPLKWGLADGWSCLAKGTFGRRLVLFGKRHF